MRAHYTPSKRPSYLLVLSDLVFTLMRMRLLPCIRCCRFHSGTTTHSLRYKMKANILYILAIALLCSFDSPAAIPPIHGQVTDAATGLPLAGATLSIAELRLSVGTDDKGNYVFSKLPARGHFLIEVKYLGYKTIAEPVDVGSVRNFALEKSIIEVQEVVVTGAASSSTNKKNSTSVTVLNKSDLARVPSANIIDAISKLPGVSQITTGSSISKPVIRGLSYNRVITLSDGVKQEGQQWGDEHGIEIDQFRAERVEVLRGAASLLYGSDAMGGVINIIDALPPSQGTIRGEATSSYASNNGLSGSSGMLEGNSNGLVWRSRVSYKNAYGLKTPDYRLPNTGFHETDVSGQLGVNRNWGYMHLDLSSFRQKLGLPEYERNEAGQFVREEENAGEEEEVIDPAQYKSRNLFTPFQDIRHYKAAVNTYIMIGEGSLRSTISFQQNQRRELEDSERDPSLFFDLKTFSYDLKYYLPKQNGWEPAIGISGAFQKNANRAEELLIPDYDSKDAGAFFYSKKNWKATTFNAGLRFDYRTIDGKQMEENGTPKFSAFSNDFSNLSGAVGITHELSKALNFKANIGSAFRAPNIAELSTGGVHEGTERYEIGNVNLKPERSYYIDAALEYQTDKADAFLNLYNNYIDNYIYLRQSDLDEMIDHHYVYHYRQDNANLYGLEAGFTLHPISLIHFENSFSITRGKNNSTRSDLPFIPAPVLRNEIRFEPAIKGMENTWFSIGLDNVFQQNHIDIFETPGAAYTLVNASAGTTVKVGRQALRLSINARNLFDKAYIDHLSRFKQKGFLNLGRNVSFSVFVPFVLRKGS